MKTKTLLFGAGESSKTYISNNETSREFIGIVDNDKQKEGLLIEGVPVISPAAIGHLVFDEIVITTQWAVEVEAQLLNELNVPHQKIVVPPKSHLKKQTPPFYNAASRQLGRNIISELSSIAINESVPLVLDFGTLLGIIRDKDIIEWDDDIDFSMPTHYFQSVLNVIEAFVENNVSNLTWKVSKTLDKKNRGIGIVLEFDDPLNNLAQFKTTFSAREVKDGKSIHLPSLGMWFAPEKHFNGTALVNWNTCQVQTPVQSSEYLAFLYGSDWNVPKKNITFTDYANTQVVEFSEFKDAGLRVESDKKIDMSLVSK
ncbi:nucleoside-diphosphate sugar epimerase/dehydratase [Alteromonas lipotrueae]|uniref:nucleoside-diphosphate sugar epimerase/dehydratase n=1 Tax=Alteromonas lipotrueae TaxID=2803814 RepID=UPI001C495E58|nr:LicD family protein [Alteromonas lipotrueae]